MPLVGETLRRARLKRNIELNRVADELKISASMLKAIEEERFEKLPGGVFARSFVRQYARFLEVDESEIVSELNKVLEPPPAAQEAAPLAPAPEIPLPRMPQWQAVGDYRGRVSSSAWALALMVLVMLGCAGAYAWWQRARHTVAVRTKTPAVTQAARKAAPVSAPPAPAVATPAPTAATPVPAPAEEKAGGGQAGDLPHEVQVELIAQEPTWVSVRTDGNYSFSGTLDANQSRTVSANRNVVLRVGNAAGLEVRLNGKSIGPLGDAGTVRTFQFTSGGFHIVPREPPKPESPAEPAPEDPNPL
jgi:cytoskeletal protein RodZ